MAEPWGPDVVLNPSSRAGGVDPGDNFFFAILPEGAPRDQAWAVADARQRTRGRPDYRVPKACLHITLGGVARGAGLTPEMLTSAKAAAGEVRMRPFLVELNRVEAWSGPSRPTVMTGEEGVIGLRDLQHRLRLALAAARPGLRWAASFEPHLTLMRGGPAAEIEYVQPIRWTVRDFVLVRSHVGAGRYTLLHRWPLTPG